MKTAIKAELAALYIISRLAVFIRIISKEIRHKQTPTPLQKDKLLEDAVHNGKIQ